MVPIRFQQCGSSAPLAEDTRQVPHLVPAKGDPEAARLWEAFELACQGVNPAASAGPTVDPETGEVKTDADGKEIDAWDEGKIALDPLGQIFQQVYGNGWLVTVDEATRIKPLTIPVKATLLGQQSERTVGALKEKQSFTLQVLDDKVDKAIEKCLKVTDVMELLTYPLSQGNRWLPEAAKGLLEKELESRNEEGKKALRDALGGDNITAEGAESLLMKQFESPNEEVKRAIQDALGGDTIKPEVAKSLVEKIPPREGTQKRRRAGAESPPGCTP